MDDMICWTSEAMVDDTFVYEIVIESTNYPNGKFSIISVAVLGEYLVAEQKQAATLSQAVEAIRAVAEVLDEEEVNIDTQYIILQGNPVKPSRGYHALATRLGFALIRDSYYRFYVAGKPYKLSRLSSFILGCINEYAPVINLSLLRKFHNKDIMPLQRLLDPDNIALWILKLDSWIIK